MSLTVSVPQGSSAEAEANQVDKEKTRNSCDLVSDRPHATLPRETCTSNELWRSDPSTRLQATARPSGPHAAAYQEPGSDSTVSHVQATFGRWIGHWSLWRMGVAGYARAARKETEGG